MNNEDIASRYLFVDLAIKNMGLDLQHIMDGNFKIKQPYINMIERLISKSIKERKRLKQLMFKNKIRIEFVVTKGQFTTYNFYLGNYEREVTFNNAVIKKHVEGIMIELLEGI